MAIEEVLLTGQYPYAAFLSRRINPPLAIYFDASSHLAITLQGSVAGVVVGVSGQFLTPEGDLSVFMHYVQAPSDRSLTTSYFQMGEGFLLHMTARVVSGNLAGGSVFCVVSAQIGGTAVGVPIATLLSDYVSELYGPDWPQSIPQSPQGGKGITRVITGTDPAAGVEISYTVPADVYWELSSMSATLLTDATVANRNPSIIIDDGTNVVFRNNQQTNQTASSTATYTFAAGGMQSNLNSGVATIGLPTPTVLLSGWRVRTSTAALVAGDNWSAPTLWVREWLS